ncbi:MAG TPA: DUF5668 domain-containing protein [Thermoanaerobaculia bacterium]|nr:DUF5668 domain-containing protein [Thermoanaerobaculia bacterium]
MRHRGCERSPVSRVVTGLIVLAVGVIFTLDTLDVLEARDFVDYWPLILIGIGMGQILGRNFGSGLLWVVVGGALLASNFGYLQIDLGLGDLIGLFWPVLMILAGLTLVRNALSRAPKDTASGDTPAMFAVMAGNQQTNNSQRFIGGDVTAVMGGCDLDLRSARIVESPAVIDVVAFWGGIELRVPRDWAVENQVTAILGGFEDKTDLPANTQQRLVIRGMAVMGGVEVKN